MPSPASQEQQAESIKQPARGAAKDPPNPSFQPPRSGVRAGDEGGPCADAQLLPRRPWRLLVELKSGRGEQRGRLWWWPYGIDFDGVFDATPKREEKRREANAHPQSQRVEVGGLHHERQEWTLRSVHNSVDSYRAFSQVYCLL